MVDARAQSLGLRLFRQYPEKSLLLGFNPLVFTNMMPTGCAFAVASGFREPWPLERLRKLLPRSVGCWSYRLTFRCSSPAVLEDLQ